MSSKHAQSETIDGVLGALTAEAIAGVSDVTLKHTLENARAMALGIAQTFLAPESDAAAKHRRELLGSVGVTLDDAKGFAADAGALLDEIKDRDAKEAAFRAAVGRTHVTEQHIDQHVSSLGMLLRGKLGAKSPDLKQFGVHPLGGGGRHKKEPAPPAK